MYPTGAALRLALMALVVSRTTVVFGEGRTLRVPGDQATIQAAIDVTHDGDVIVVEPGTYREHLVVDGKSVTLQSKFATSRDPGDVERTVLDGGPEGKRKGAPLVYVKTGEQSQLKLVGFTIQNSHHAVIVSGWIEAVDNRFVENGDALSFESGRGAVRSNVFEQNDDDGIDMDGASAATIEDNLLRDNKDDGIEIRLHKYRGDILNIVIRGNRFIGNREDGLQLIDYPGMSDRAFRIERNVFLGNDMAAIGTMAEGNTKENYKGAEMPELVLIVNNTLLNNNYGITGGHNMVLLNNVIAGTKQAALKHIHGDSAAGVNLLWNNGADVDDCDLHTAEFAAVDPRLDRDGKPLPDSPCLDGGAATLEFNGERLELATTSYSGKAPDLGAIEANQTP